MQIFKLARKNIFRQFHIYFLYLLNMSFSVMVYYSFLTMMDYPELEKITSSQSITTGLQLGSGIILLFLVVFMISANHFFMNQRHKEFGLYTVLGMRKSQIIQLLFLEMMYLSGTSLVIGLLLGGVFSKLFGLILGKAMLLNLKLPFYLSLVALKKVSRDFMLVFLFIFFQNGFRLYRTSLVTLFKRNQPSTPSTRYPLFLLLIGVGGISLLAYGYWQASHFTSYMTALGGVDTGLLKGSFFILISCVVGTYFLFYGGLPILLIGLKKVKSIYYKDLHMITISRLYVQLKENARMLATIGVLAGTSFSLIGGTTGLSDFLLQNAKARVPVSYMIDQQSSESFKKKLTEKKIDYTAKSIEVKQVGSYWEKELFRKQDNYIGPSSFIRESDYQSVKKYLLFSLPSVKLENGEIIYLDQKNELLIEGAKTGEKIRLSQTLPNFSVKEKVEDKLGGQGGIRYNQPTFILTDEDWEKLPRTHSYGYDMIQLKHSSQETLANQLYHDQIPEVLYGQIENYYVQNNQLIGAQEPERNVESEASISQSVPEGYGYLTRKNSMSYYDEWQEARHKFGLITYVAVFLGITFLLAIGSIIMLKQLSQADEDRKRYQWLAKIGASQAQIKQTIYQQNRLIFFLPITIALSHAYFALQAFSHLSDISQSPFIFIVIAFLLLLYILFYRWTSAVYYQLVVG